MPALVRSAGAHGHGCLQLRERRGDGDFFQPHGTGAAHADGAFEPAVPPLVLVFHVGGVGPLHDRDRDEGAVPGTNERRDVELACEARVFCQPDRLTVHPNRGDALCTVDGEHDALAGPLGRNGDGAAVDAGRVVVGHARRIAHEDVLDVRVVRQVGGPRLTGPAVRHVDRVPIALGLGGAYEFVREQARGVEQRESPRSIETALVVRVRNRKRRPHRKAPVAHDLRRLPHRPRRRRHHPEQPVVRHTADGRPCVCWSAQVRFGRLR
jgi:hypothetical protein